MKPLFEPGRPKTGGRVKGSRNKLSMKFVEALCADFEAHGEEAIKIVRVEDPSAYLRVIAALLPKEFEITDNRLKDIPDDQLDAIIDRIRREVDGAEPADSGTGQTAH